MASKFIIFGHKIEWYDIKTKAKKILRSMFYGRLIQGFVCYLIVGYMWFVYLTSKKKFINFEKYLEIAKLNKPVIMASWHNRLMMMPFTATLARSVNKNYDFTTLASQHGDGRFVGLVMQAFGFTNIYGSSQDGRKKTRGISLHSVREILRNLKKGQAFGITPDGPRGPNQKINSEIIAIAKIANCPILPLSYSCSKFIQFNSWDKFKMPLPFSKLCFYAGNLIYVDASVTSEDEALLKLKLEAELNLAQEKSQEIYF